MHSSTRPPEAIVDSDRSHMLRIRFTPGAGCWLHSRGNRDRSKPGTVAAPLPSPASLASSAVGSTEYPPDLLRPRRPASTSCCRSGAAAVASSVEHITYQAESD